MATSRKDAWAGNSAAMIHLFSKPGYKPMTPSEKMMAPFTEMPAHNWNMFLIKAEPLRGSVIFESITDRKEIDFGYRPHTLSYLCRRARVINEFPNERENQNKTNYPSATTIVDGVSDHTLEAMRCYKDDLLGLGFSFAGFEGNRNISSGLEFHFNYGQLITAFGSDVVVKEMGGKIAALRLRLDIGIGVKFTATFITQKTNHDGKLAISEDDYFREHSKRKSLPSFYTVAKAIYDKLEPIAKKEGYFDFNTLLDRMKVEEEIEREKLKENKRRVEALQSTISQQGLPTFVRNALHVAMGDAFKLTLVKQVVTKPSNALYSNPALAFDLHFEGSSLSVNAKVSTHVCNCNKVDPSVLLDYVGIPRDCTLIAMNDTMDNSVAYSALARAVNSEASKILNSLDLFRVFRILRNNTFGPTSNDNSLIVVSMGGYGILNITYVSTYRNIGFTVNFSIQRHRDGQYWL